MALGDVNPSSFEAYEGIRIIIPGAIAVTIYGAVVATLTPSLVSPASNTVGGIVAALLVGLVLLFLDLPAKSAAYVSSDVLPDRELERWGVEPGTFRSHANLYFTMLDISVPATIRNRSLYMGSIYRIGFEGIYFVGLGSLGVFTALAAFPEVGPNRGGATASRDILIVAAAAHGLVFGGAILVRVLYRYGDDGNWLRATGTVITELGREVGPVGLSALLASSVVFGFFVSVWSWYLIVAAVAIHTVTWATLYLVGYVHKGHSPRRRLAPPAACALYIAPAVAAIVAVACRVDGSSSMSTPFAVGWSALSLTVAIMIASRGHERKLNGSFAAQTTWLRMNKNELIQTYGLTVRPSEPSVAALAPGLARTYIGGVLARLAVRTLSGRGESASSDDRGG